MKLEFVKSAVEPKQYPVHRSPEVVVVGRSNSGKSSFLNAISGGRVAKVSQRPGKTQTLNFFKIHGAVKGHIVDVPGYGYAGISKAERKQWQSMLETYFSTRGQLCAAYLLMDIRRDFAAEEADLFEFLSSIDIPLVLVLTKADKVGGNERRETQKKFEKKFGQDGVLVVSNVKKTGFDQVMTNLMFHLESKCAL